MSNIAIRADGGTGIGMGHVMRCLSLATAFEKYGHTVYFFSKSYIGINLIEMQDFPVVRLNNEDIVGGLDEVNDVIGLLKEYNIDILIVDSYNVSESYFNSLRSQVEKLVYIDDENKLCISADVIINGNLTAEYLGYSKYDDTQMLLLGPEYNLIRNEFRDVPTRVIKENVESIMITTGGADSFNITKKLLNILLKAECFSDLKFNVLVGSVFTNVDELIELCKIHSRLKLFTNQHLNKYPEINYSSVADLMFNSDIAISAGGSTLYEFAACGTPVLAFILADNQQFLVKKMSEMGYVLNLGWYYELKDKVVIYSLKSLINNFTKRAVMSSMGQRLVDARGAERIIRKLL